MNDVWLGPVKAKRMKYCGVIQIFKLTLLLILLQFNSRSHSQEIDSATVTIMGVGDIMLGTSFPSKKYLPSNDSCDFLLHDVKGDLQDTDITFGNLECCFLDKGKVVIKCKDTRICYAFRTPVKDFNCLGGNGLDIFSLANNHILDFDELGIEQALELIEQNNTHAAGLLSSPYEVFERGGMRFGFCAFLPNKASTRINNYVGVQKIISYLEEVSDIVIVSFHGGAEGKSYQNVTRETEMFYDEDRGNVYEFPRLAIDAGADIVFGRGPHVTGTIVLYKDRLIAYSLGNFCTYRRMNLKGPNGVAAILKVFTDGDGKFQKARIIPVIQYDNAGPVHDPGNTMIKIV